jgi:hypothetical protein
MVGLSPHPGGGTQVDLAEGREARAFRNLPGLRS